MDKKKLFIETIDDFMRKGCFEDFISELEPEEKDAITSFWEDFKNGKSVGGFTENGIKILNYMNENLESNNNLFSAKVIGEGLFISSRSVSGAMRKLIADGYIEKHPGNPVLYSLTDSGKEVEI